MANKRLEQYVRRECGEDFSDEQVLDIAGITGQLIASHRITKGEAVVIAMNCSDAKRKLGVDDQRLFAALTDDRERGVLQALSNERGEVGMKNLTNIFQLFDLANLQKQGKWPY